MSTFVEQQESNLCRPLSGVDISDRDTNDVNIDVNMRVAIKLITYIRKLEQRLNERERIRDNGTADVLALYKALNQDMLDQVRYVQKLNNTFIVLTIVMTVIVITIGITMVTL